LNLIQRRRLFFVVLVMLACWPLAHLILAQKYLINPWELGGFAMYVQPNLPIEVRLYQPSGEIFPFERLDRMTIDALERYRNRAAILGLLASPDELAQALRQSGQAPEELEIELRRQMIDSTGQLIYQTRKRRILRP